MKLEFSFSGLNMFIRFVLGLAVLQLVTGAINRLTDEEFDRLPPLFKLDRYYRCHRERGNYCWIKAKIIGNSSNPIYNTLEEYSSNKITHFDRTFLYRGLCPKTTCPEIDSNSTDSMQAMESCLNSTMYTEYQLNTRVVNSLCTDYKDKVILDASDYAFIAIVFVLLMLNVLGSFYDFLLVHENKTGVGKFLVCFSMRRNWDRLVAPTSTITNSKLRRLKCLSAFRTVNVSLIVLGHAPLAGIALGNNPGFVEATYRHVHYHMLYSGTLVVQTFFIMSGLLMAYNVIAAKSVQHSWMLPKKVLLRWLRLTPPYALTMFFVMTWARHIGDGPLWKAFVTVESEDCRRDWWRHLLYIQNYHDRSQCMTQAWYLAADMQLSVLGLIILCLLKSSKARKVAIGLVFAVGLVTPAAHTYFQNLHAILIVSPEMAMNYFVNDRTFNNLYKRGHTNLVCYAMGMALAFIIYKLQDSDIDSLKFKKFRILYWLLFPIEFCLVISGAVFYIDGIQVPLAARAVYSSVIKVVFGLVICLHIFFTVIKVDRLCRSVLHWNGWTYLARLTYCAYIVHVCIIRTSAGGVDSLIRLSEYWCILNIMSILAATYVLAFPFHMLVEAPIGCLVKTYLDSGKKQPEAKHTSVVGQVTTEKDILVVNSTNGVGGGLRKISVV